MQRDESKFSSPSATATSTSRYPLFNPTVNANTNSNNSNETTAQRNIANATSLSSFNHNDNAASMFVPKSNQSTNYPHAQQQQQGAVPAISNSTGWLQHMILNPINPLQSNLNSIRNNNAGDNGSGGANNQTNIFARQQILQGNNHGNADNNLTHRQYHHQQMSDQLGDTTTGGSCIVTSQSKQQHQSLKQPSLPSQQVWPSQGQQQQHQQQQNLQQGLQRNRLLSLQQQQLLPFNEIASQLQLPLIQTQQLQQQQAVATSNSNQMTALPSPTTIAAPSTVLQQQQKEILFLASMLQQNNANNNNTNFDPSELLTALASPEGIRLLNSFLHAQQPPPLQEHQVQQHQQASHLPHSGSAGSGPAPSSSNLGVGHPSPVPVSGIKEDANTTLNQQQFFLSSQSQQSQAHLQSQLQQLHGIPLSLMSLLNPTVSSLWDPNGMGKIGETQFGASAVNQHLPSPMDGPPPTGITSIDSTSNRFAGPNLSMPGDSAVSEASHGKDLGSIDMGFLVSPPSSVRPPIQNDTNSKDGNHNKTTTKNSQFPRTLYCESDDLILGEYQTLLRQQLELFEADSNDVINGTFRQGRTTPIRMGQIGLRCKHCAKAPLSVRTKGSVYFSQTIKGMYQIGQNMSKVHLCERCVRLPPDIKKKMIMLRNRRHRASGGRAYWIRHMRELGIYEDSTVLRAHPLGERKKPPDGKMPSSAAHVTKK